MNKSLKEGVSLRAKYVFSQEIQKIIEKNIMPTLFSTWDSDEVPPTVAKYRIAYLALTVFPAPDSPETMMDWFRFSLKIWKKLNKNKITVSET